VKRTQTFSPSFFAEPQSADPSDFSRIAFIYWVVDTKDVIAGKLRDKEGYEKELRLCFQDGSEGT
jgi:hypothetical protein